MNEHLNSEEISQAVAGERLWPHRHSHLDSCPQCAAELGEARAQLAGFRQSVRAAAQHPEAFWARQRYVIGCRISDAQLWRHRLLRPAWIATAAASAAVIFFVFALSLGSIHRIAPLNTQTAQISSPTDSDDLLLADVQAELQRDVPAALEPAHLLMEQVPQASSVQQRAAHRVLKVNSSSPAVREF
jgi:hypothetical protein